MAWTKLLHCDRIYLSEKYRRCFEFLLSPAKRKLLLMPRGTYKSTILCSFVAREIVKNPDIRILYASETYAQAKTYLAWVRRQFESNPDIKHTAGDLVGRSDWRNDTFTVKTRKDLSKKESTLTAAGIDVTKVGMHYDLIIIDDCVSNTNTMTAGQMQKTLNWYRLLIPILEPGGTIIVCGTRYDEEDLYGEIIKANTELEKIWASTPEDQRRPEFMPFEIMIEQAETDGKPNFDHLDSPSLRVKRATLGPYIYACTPGYAKVLMSDWTEKPIEQVRVGDEVVGFIRKDGTDKARFEKAVVQAIGTRRAMVLELSMSSGRKVYCTADHKWYTGRGDKSHQLYLPARTGRKMICVSDVLSHELHPNRTECAYLAGMIDGEGCIGRSFVSIAQSRSHNPEVCERIERCLIDLGLPITRERYDYKDLNIWRLLGGREILLWLLKNCDLGKAEQIRSRLWEKSGMPGMRKDRVISMREIGEDIVYSMQTSTGNYISQTYMSKNCQYQNDPSSRDNAIFTRDLFKIIPKDQVPKALNIYMLTDSATTEDGCQSAIFVIGKDQLDIVYVLDGWAAPATPDTFEKMFFSLWVKWWPRHALFEKVPINDNYVTILARTSRERQIPIRTEWVMGRSTESKDERIISMQARFVSGRIFFSDGIPPELIHLEGQEAWGDIPRQFCRFRPRSGARNDIPDCLSDMDKRDHRTNSELCPAPRFRINRPPEVPGTVNGQFNFQRPPARRRPGPGARETFWEQQRRLSDNRRAYRD